MLIDHVGDQARAKVVARRRDAAGQRREQILAIGGDDAFAQVQRGGAVDHEILDEVFLVAIVLGTGRAAGEGQDDRFGVKEHILLGAFLRTGSFCPIGRRGVRRRRFQPAGGGGGGGGFSLQGGHL